jgi:DNA-binding protein YbaB
VEYPALDRIERMVSNMDTWQRQMSEQIAEVDQHGVEGTSESGLVTAASSSGGQILRVHIEPRAMRMPSEDLAKEVVAAIQQAQQAASEKVREMMRSVIGEDPR